MEQHEQNRLSEICDRKGRRIAEKILTEQYGITDFKGTDIKEHYDATFNLRGYRYALEVKYRKGYSRTDPRVKKGGLLERHKVDMMNDNVPEGYRKVYMLIWNDGTADIWNIDNLNNINEDYNDDLPKVSVNPDAGRGGKDVYYLPFNDEECKKMRIKHKKMIYDARHLQ